MTSEPFDIFLERLYSSNDPLCMEAGAMLEAMDRQLATQEKRIHELSSGVNYMLEGLLEINRLSRQRDSHRPKQRGHYITELNLRLNECGNVARDTMSLESVKRASGIYNKT